MKVRYCGFLFLPDFSQFLSNEVALENAQVLVGWFDVFTVCLKGECLVSCLVDQVIPYVPA